MTPEQELLDTIEEIRNKHFPEISTDLVKKLSRSNGILLKTGPKPTIASLRR
jgi:hypothetical protein